MSQSKCKLKDVDKAVEACLAAQREFLKVSKKTRRSIIRAMRDKARQYAESLAEEAAEETGRGRAGDKVKKNKLVIEKTPGMEDLQSTSITGDCGTTLIEQTPYGIVASITPTTNPTATVINNSISLLSAGNGVIFAPHPAAARCTSHAADLLHAAAVEKGAPAGIICVLTEPSLDQTQELMAHKDVSLVLVTGGPAPVKAAFKVSNKRVMASGPGNPPVLVDETADLAQAALDIVHGASFDNNMVCSDEKEVFCVEEVFDRFMGELERTGEVQRLNSEEGEKLTKFIFQEGQSGAHQMVKKELVGMNASYILEQAGILVRSDLSEDRLRLIVLEVGQEDPLIFSEQLMPVLPVAKVKNFKEGVKCAAAAEGGRRHSASLFTARLDRVREYNNEVTACNIVVNGPIYAGLGYGGEGYTSFSIAGFTGEGYTRPSTFTRERRLSLVENPHRT